MRRLMVFALSTALLWTGARADEPARFSVADRAAIRSVIESQIAAFRRDDGAEAFSYASPAIRQKFGTAQNFMTMVRSAYAAVYRPREVEFRALRTVAGEPVQEVLVVGPDGRAVMAEYIMQRQLDGNWRVNGVLLVVAPDEVT